MENAMLTNRLRRIAQRMFTPMACMALVLAITSIALTCPNNGPIDVGCGSGANGCVGGNQANCTADDAKTLNISQFGCGLVIGEQNCVNADDPDWMDVCYTEYDCLWDAMKTPKCYTDTDNPDHHYDWIKVSDPCPPGG
jgi:hypothetical protein